MYVYPYVFSLLQGYKHLQGKFFWVKKLPSYFLFYAILLEKADRQQQLEKSHKMNI